MPPFLGNMTAASGLPKQQQFNRLGGSSCSHPVPFLLVSFLPCPDYPFAFWFIYLFICFSTIPKLPNSPQLWNFFWGTLHILGDRLVSTRWCLSWGLSPTLLPSLGNCSGISGDYPSPSPGLPPISWKACVVEWGPLGKTATVFFTMAVLPCREGSIMIGCVDCWDSLIGGGGGNGHWILTRDFGCPCHSFLTWFLVVHSLKVLGCPRDGGWGKLSGRNGICALWEIHHPCWIGAFQCSSLRRTHKPAVTPPPCLSCKEAQWTLRFS